MTSGRYSWTQPCCRDCWRQHNPDREPAVLIAAEQETCCYCGSSTSDGIYVRVHPQSVDHPTLTK